MGLVICADCNREVSDRAGVCPHCGCPISVSIEEARLKKSEKQEVSKEPDSKLFESTIPSEEDTREYLIHMFDKKLAYDISVERQNLFNILSPYLVDSDTLFEVKDNLLHYLVKWDVIPNMYKLVSAPFEHFFDDEERRRNHWNQRRKSVQQTKSDALSAALAAYNKQISEITTTGMGFSIITSSPVSAALFSAMNAREHEKQFYSKSLAADKFLLERLNDINNQGNSIDKIYEKPYCCSCDKAVNALETTLVLLGKVCSSWNYCHDNSLDCESLISVDDINVFMKEFISFMIEKKKYIITYSEDTQLLPLIASGYIFSYYSGFDNLYYAFITESYARLLISGQEAEKNGTLEDLYKEANDELVIQKYYAAARHFYEIRDYKDSLRRCIQIWNNHILCCDFLTQSYHCLIAMAESGRCMATARSSYQQSEDVQLEIEQVQKWTEVAQIPHNLVGISGIVDSVSRDKYGKVNSIGKASTIKKLAHDLDAVIDIVCWDDYYAFLQQNGTVYVTDTFEKKQFTEVRNWHGISRILFENGCIVGLTNDNRVVVDGRVDSDVRSQVASFCNVERLLGVSSKGSIICLDQYGKVLVATSDPEERKAEDWKDVVRVVAPPKEDGPDLVFGLTSRGTVLCIGGIEELQSFCEGLFDVVDLVFDNSWVQAVLKCDGTVVFYGSHIEQDWEGILKLYSDGNSIYGVDTDGRIRVSFIGTRDTYVESQGWKLFENADTYLKKINEYLLHADEKLQDSHSEVLQEHGNEIGDDGCNESDAKCSKTPSKSGKNFFIALFGVLFLAFLILYPLLEPRLKYHKALGLLESGDYDAAYVLLEEIGKNEDIVSNKYNRAMDLLESGDYDAAYELLGEIGKKEEIVSNKYNRAMELIDSGDYDGALLLIEGLDYKDSAEQVDNCYISKYGEEKYNQVKNTNIGDVYKFGSYEQDVPSTLGNDKDEIEWIVLEKKGMTMLLISKYALDCQPYNESKVATTWESCSLRKWLNDTFLCEAFTIEEQSKIIISTITAESNLSYDTPPGNDTEDKIFLLSISEAEKYFKSDKERECKPTEYAKIQDSWCVTDEEKGTCPWWLRSPGNDSKSAAGVFDNGLIFRFGEFIDSSYFTVRPALWIDLGS